MPAVTPTRDPHARAISYLRLSVTDLCNLRCRYCMPPEGVTKLSHREVLRNEEFLQVARAAVQLGVHKIRVTGGEPLVRPGLLDLLAELSALPGLRTLAMTSNGTLLAEKAAQLRAAGVQRINVSMDTLDPRRYRQVTCRGELADVVAGIDAAHSAGLGVKVNAVLTGDTSIHTVTQLIDFAAERDIAVRFIEQMSFDRDEAYVSEDEMLAVLGESLPVVPQPVDAEHAHVRRYLVGGVRVGFISPRSHSFCGACNKLRLTPNGQLRACLASHLHVDVRSVLRRPHTEADLREAFLRAVGLKPAAAPWDTHGEMWRVGG